MGAPRHRRALNFVYPFPVRTVPEPADRSALRWPDRRLVVTSLVSAVLSLVLLGRSGSRTVVLTLAIGLPCAAAWILVDRIIRTRAVATGARFPLYIVDVTQPLADRMHLDGVKTRPGRHLVGVGANELRFVNLRGGRAGSVSVDEVVGETSDGQIVGVEILGEAAVALEATVLSKLARRWASG